MLRAATAREELGISPALAVFVSNSLIRRARFSFTLLAGRLAGYCGLIKGGVL
jgi:hypothetical protein